MSSRGGRRYLPIRVSEDGHRELQRRADEETDGNVSEMVRRLLKYAITRMPRGWGG